MEFREGDDVLRPSAFGGWERGVITGRVGTSDSWYVRTGPGRTYMDPASELRPVVTAIEARRPKERPPGDESHPAAEHHRRGIPVAHLAALVSQILDVG